MPFPSSETLAGLNIRSIVAVLPNPDEELLEYYHRMYLKRLHRMELTEQEIDRDYHAPRSEILAVRQDGNFVGFGVSDYADNDLDLKYAHKDALDLAALFSSLEGTTMGCKTRLSTGTISINSWGFNAQSISVIVPAIIILRRQTPPVPHCRPAPV